MRKFKKSAALALAAMMALSSAQLVVMADNDESLPNAVVTELKGNDLNVTLNSGFEGFGALPGGVYTLNKAARFVTTDNKDDPESWAQFKYWLCDYRVTLANVDYPEVESIDGNQVYLYGSYAGFEDIAFKVSEIAQRFFDSDNIPMGTYDLMYATNIDPTLNYKDIVTSVKDFKCGLIDNGLPYGTEITVQLVMYKDGVRSDENRVNIGDSIVYYKAPPTTEGEELIPVGDIDSTVKELPADGVPNLTVEGIKDAMVATEKTKLINDYIVKNNITVPDEGTVMVDMDVYAKTEPLAENKFELTPHALITSDGQPAKDIEISNDQLEEDAKIKIEVPSAKEPLYIMHRSEGYEPEKYTEGDPEAGLYFSYENGVCKFYVSHFSDIELITDPVMITDVDAYVDNNNKGNLRFITTYYGTDPVTNFGTWIVPQDIFNDTVVAAKYANNTSTSISDDDTFTADLMEIPDTMLNTVFYAKSYVNVGGSEAWTETSKSATVKQYENKTSATYGK